MPKILESLSHPSLEKAVEITYQTAMTYLGHIFAARFYYELEATWFVKESIEFSKVINIPFRADTPKSTIDATLKNIAASTAGAISWEISPFIHNNNLKDCLYANGWLKDEEIRSMALDLHTLKKPTESPAGLTIERVDNEEAFKQHIDIMIAGFEFPEPIAHYLSGRDYGREFLNNPATLYYVGRVNGQAVAISFILLCEGIAGIYNVATIPQMRRQGFGTAMTVAALLEALAQGYHVAVLQASDLGINIYRNLGFQDHFTFDSYSLQREAKK